MLGVPRGVYYPAPFQIFQRDNDVTLIHQFGHQVRTIATNGSDHPEEKQQEFWLGDSRGHWDGDRLVVDTTNFNGRGQISTSAAGGRIRGIPQSAAAHIVERFTRTDADTILYEVSIDDPEVYTGPWKLEIPLTRDPHYVIYEYACHEGNYALPSILSGGRAQDASR